MQTLIKLENVEKTYKLGDVKVQALDKINLEVYENDFVAIQGPSGSGKSTIVNMIGCLDTPTKGKIFLKNQDIATLSESELAQIRGKTIGFVFQVFNLMPTLTALENVLMPSIFTNSTSSKEQKAISLLEKVGLKDRLKHRPNELSGGQKQRVAIARALINSPEIIIADEPTGNLDSKTGKEIIDLLIQLYKEENKTLIIVTHDQEIAKKAKRKVFIKDGQVIKEN